jgi:hypothetical protein
MAIALILALALVIDLRSTSQTSFHFKFTKSGGIAGINNTLIVTEDGSATFTGASSFKSKINPVDFSEFKDVLKNLDQISSRVLQARAGAADYFSYKLTLNSLGKTTEIFWVDEWAVDQTFPERLRIIQSAIEKIIQIITAESTFKNRNNVHADLKCDTNYLCGALSMMILTDKTIYRSGEQVRVVTILRNSSPQNIAYQSSTPCDPDIRVLVSGGTRTQDISLSNHPIPLLCIQIIEQRSLQSNGSIIHEVTWNLIFDQDGSIINATPGTYTISAKFPYSNFESTLLEAFLTITIGE